MSNEDWELFLHLLNDGRLTVFVPVVLGYYYQNPASLSADYSKMLRIGEQVQRVFDRGKLRSADNELIGRMYHPQLGWII
jgi:succinoglycan biosynthesis protein ExoO